MDEKQALEYAHQLHPAYAGYFHDGFVSNKDALAYIFYLSNKGHLEFVWEDNDPLKKIITIKRTQSAPKDKLDNVVITSIFLDNDTIHAEKLEDTSYLSVIKGYIQASLISQGFNLKGSEATIDLNEESINLTSVYGDVPEVIRKLSKGYKYGILTMFTLLIIFSIGFLTLYYTSNLFQRYADVNGYMGNFIAIVVGGIIAIIIFFFTVYNGIRKSSTKRYSIKYKGDKNLKLKYLELYHFLITHPLDERKWDNEFLPYSIAFGLSTRWNKEFGFDVKDASMSDYIASNKTE